MKISNIPYIFFIAALSACAAIPAANNPGKKPNNAEDQAIGYIKHLLKDPDSMKISNVEKPQIRTCADGLNAYNVWSVAVTYNSKNGFGGYNGYSTQYVWFANYGKPYGLTDAADVCPTAGGYAGY